MKIKTMKNLFIFICIFLFCAESYSQNKTWKCINEKEETLFTIEAKRVYPFSNGLARIYRQELINNTWIHGYGYIDTTGQIVIPCIYKKANDFVGDFVWVRKKGNEHYTLIDKKGNVIPTKKYKKVGYFYEFQKDICAVYEDGRMGFVDMSGKEIIPCKYMGQSYFKEGLACIAEYDAPKEKYGFMNSKGEFEIPIQFYQGGVTSFNEGLVRAKINGKTVLINNKGETIFKTNKGNIISQNFGLIRIITKPNRKGWGWINFKDEFVISPIYDDATPFNKDGYAVVEKNGLKGLIDTTGKIILDFKYETIYSDISKDGYIMGVYPSEKPIPLLYAKKDYFNANFDKIEMHGMLHIYSADNGNLMPFIDINKKYGYVNRDFNVVIISQYEKAKEFTEGKAWALP